jgi:hypothetical protein
MLQSLRRGTWSGDDQVPEILVYLAYGLFAAGVLACLAFVARNFEDEDL